VVLATTDATTVDATLETATSLVRYVVTAERAVFVDLVGRGSVTPWTHGETRAELPRVPACDILVVLAERGGVPAPRFPHVLAVERTPFATVLEEIRAALEPVPLAANAR
jgi:hypothetical protein